MTRHDEAAQYLANQEIVTADWGWEDDERWTALGAILAQANRWGYAQGAGTFTQDEALALFHEWRSDQ